MKKSFLVFLVFTVACMALWLFSTYLLQSRYNRILDETSHSWSNRIDARFIKDESYINAFIAFLETTINDEILMDSEQKTRYYEFLESYVSQIVRENTLLDLYVFFAPEVTDPPLHFSAVNLKLDGNVMFRTDVIYSRETMTGAEWEWYNRAVRNEKYLSEPYSWPRFDGQLISLTKSVHRNGEVIGVAGIDYYTSFLTPLLEESSLGRFVIINSEGKILFHRDPERIGQPYFTGYSIARVGFERFISSAGQSVFLYGGPAPLIIRKLDSGWISVMEPDIQWYLRDNRLISLVMGLFWFLLSGLFFYTRHLMFNLKKRQEEADQANRAKTLFLGSISHELRTPLTAIIGFSGRLETRDNLTADQKTDMGIIRKAGENLLQIINDLIDLARLEGGQFRPEPENFDPGAQLEEIRILLEPKAREKGLDLEVVRKPSLPSVITADRHRIRQMLVNLAGNAVKFTRAGTIVLSGEMVFSKNGPILRLTVTDTGPGIAPEYLDQIFLPFARLERDRDKEGSGMGLSITAEYAQKLGGSVRAENREEGGARFILEIPVSLPDTDTH